MVREWWHFYMFVLLRRIATWFADWATHHRNQLPPSSRPPEPRPPLELRADDGTPPADEQREFAWS